MLTLNRFNQLGLKNVVRALTVFKKGMIALLITLTPHYSYIFKTIKKATDTCTIILFFLIHSSVKNFVNVLHHVTSFPLNFKFLYKNVLTKLELDCAPLLTILLKKNSKFIKNNLS